VYALREWSRRRGTIGVVGLVLAGSALGVLLPAGCTESSLYRNIIAPTSGGDVRFLFINDTDYRALFSFGTWNDLNRAPGEVDFQQLRLEAHSSSEEVTATCSHNAAVGTDKLVARVVATEADDVEGFDPEAFNSRVGFSSFPEGSEGEGLADAGHANGVEVLLGVDYSCGDVLVFTFVEDDAADDGFRVDYAVLVSEE
jgi:hypothetical protein